MGSRIYFGFSTVINLRQGRDKTLAAIAAVPINRILIESDLDDADGLQAELYNVCQLVAVAKQVSIQEAASATWHNTKRFALSNLDVGTERHVD